MTSLPNEAIEDGSFTNLADKLRQQSVAVAVEETEKQHPFSDCVHNHNNPNVKEEYAESSDLADTVNVTNPSYQESDSYPMKSCHAQNMDGVNEDINLEKMLEVDEFFDSMSEDAQPEQHQISLLEDNIYVPPNHLDSLEDHCPSDQDKMALCEAPSNNLFLHENTDVNGFLYSPTLEPSGFEMFDDLLAYFDATDDNLHYCTTGSECISPPEAFDFVGEVKSSIYLLYLLDYD